MDKCIDFYRHFNEQNKYREIEDLKNYNNNFLY